MRRKRGLRLSIPPLVLSSLTLLSASTSASFVVKQSPTATTLLSGVPIDIDHDGDLDLVLAQYNPDEEIGSGVAAEDVKPLTLLAAVNDDGRFEITKKPIRKLKAIRVGHQNLAAADFNGDGLTDVYAGDSGVDRDNTPGGRNRLALGTRNGKLIDKSSRLYPEWIEFTHGIAVGDVDGNGGPDIYEANVGCGGANCEPVPVGPALFINDGKGKFTVGEGRLPMGLEQDTTDVEPPSGGEFNSAAFIDADRDGDQDLVLGWAGPAVGFFTVDPPPGEGWTEELLLNDGTGFFNWTPAGTMPPRRIEGDASNPGLTNQVIPADLDGDGWLDLVLLNGSRDFEIPLIVQILKNQRDGTFADASGGLPDVTTDLITVSDLNGDGYPDIFGTSSEGLPLLLLNRGRFKFKIAKNVFAGEGAVVNNLAQAEAFGYAADYDADGDNDIVFLGGGGLYYAENVDPIDPVKNLKKPGKPKTRGPNGTIFTADRAILEWKHAKRAATYRIEVAIDTTFDSVIYARDGWTGNSIEVSELDAGTMYFWRVRGNNLRATGKFSKASSFTTAN